MRSLSKYLLSTYEELDIVLGTRHTAVEEGVPVITELTFQRGQQTINTETIKQMMIFKSNKCFEDSEEG